MWHLVFLILAVILFLAAGFDVKVGNRIQLGWLGLAALTVAVYFRP